LLLGSSTNCFDTWWSHSTSIFIRRTICWNSSGWTEKQRLSNRIVEENWSFVCFFCLGKFTDSIEFFG